MQIECAGQVAEAEERLVSYRFFYVVAEPTTLKIWRQAAHDQEILDSCQMSRPMSVKKT